MSVRHETQTGMQAYTHILMLSAWGFAIVMASFLFLYAGYMIDKYLGTSPSFMFGLFFLAIFTSIGKLFQEAWQRQKQL